MDLIEDPAERSGTLKILTATLAEIRLDVGRSETWIPGLVRRTPDPDVVLVLSGGQWERFHSAHVRARRSQIAAAA